MNMNIGKMLMGFFHDVFGGGSNSGADVPAPILLVAPIPTIPTTVNSDHYNGVDVSTDFMSATPETGGGIQAAMTDVSFQTFISAMMAAVEGKDGAVLVSNLSESSNIQFGYLRDVTYTNPDGTTWTYQQLDSFAQIQENSYSDVEQNTDGSISFNGSAYWSGFYDPSRVTREDVTIWSDSYSSLHDEITLIGIGNQLPDMFDYAGGKG